MGGVEMDRVEIAEVTIPERVDAPDAADFVAAIAVRNAVNEHDSGTRDDVRPPEELLPGGASRNSNRCGCSPHVSRGAS